MEGFGKKFVGRKKRLWKSFFFPASKVKRGRKYEVPKEFTCESRFNLLLAMGGGCYTSKNCVECDKVVEEEVLEEIPEKEKESEEVTEIEERKSAKESIQKVLAIPPAIPFNGVFSLKGSTINPKDVLDEFETQEYVIVCSATDPSIPTPEPMRPNMRRTITTTRRCNYTVNEEAETLKFYFRHGNLAGEMFSELEALNGKLYWDVNGNFIQGQWVKKEIKSGDVLVDGDLYIGQLKDFQMHGHGKMHYKDGSMFEGEWNQGERHGDGVLEFKSGGMYHCKVKGKWEKNELVDLIDAEIAKIKKLKNVIVQ